MTSHMAFDLLARIFGPVFRLFYVSCIVSLLRKRKLVKNYETIERTVPMYKLKTAKIIRENENKKKWDTRIKIKFCLK